MSNSLRIAPAPSHATTHTPSANFSAPSAPGLHDTLRASLQPTTTTSGTTTTTPSLQSAHPLESRLAHWRQTQQTLKHTLLRRQFGISAPLIREMELLTVENGRGMLGGGGVGVHGDVLRGVDAECSWEDVFVGDVTQPVPDFHAEMEARMKMNW